MAREQRRAAADSGGVAGSQPWERLNDSIVEIALPRLRLRTDTSFEIELSDWLKRVHDAHGDAKEKARRIVENLDEAITDTPSREEMGAVAKAISTLVDALAECASACEAESHDHVGRIGGRLRILLDRFEADGESKNNPTQAKTPDAGGLAHSLSDSAGVRKPRGEEMTVKYEAASRKE
jgi:hypothetical protein